MTKEDKIKQIEEHPDYGGRAIEASIKLLKSGIPLEKWDVYEKAIQNAFKKGKNKNPSYIKQQTRKTKKFLDREFKDIEIKTNYLE